MGKLSKKMLENDNILISIINCVVHTCKGKGGWFKKVDIIKKIYFTRIRRLYILR